MISSPRSPQPVLRDLLRACTSEAHRALEATPLMLAFANGSASAPQYREYLFRQLGLHLALEAGLAAWVSPGDSRLRLVKAGWLRADLDELDKRDGVDDLGTDLDAAPTLPGIPAIASHAAALGVLYVLEGSTLGLQVVRKRLAECHPGIQAASRFLSGYGTHTGRHWRTFLDSLNALPGPEWPETTGAACATFAVFQRLFSEPLHVRKPSLAGAAPAA